MSRDGAAPIARPRRRRPAAAAGGRSAIPALHAAWGAALLCAPATLLRVTRHDPSPVARRVLQVLGVRHMVQAAAVAERPGATALRMSGAVDVLHAATCVILAAADTRWRPPAAVGSLIASAFAAGEFRAARGAVEQPVKPRAARRRRRSPAL